MKLTKGKIAKLYKKNKQSFNKINKKKTYSKSKTFRKNKKLNLHKKTLKKIYKKIGGDEASGDEASDNIPEVNPSLEKTDIPVTKVDMSTLPDTSSISAQLDAATPSISEPISSENKVTGDDIPVTKVDMSALPDTSAVSEQLAQPNTEPEKLEDNANSNAEVNSEKDLLESSINPQVTEQNSEKNVLESSINPDVQSVSVENIESPSATGKPVNGKLEKALLDLTSAIGEDLANTVLKKISQGEVIQDSFNKIPETMQTFSESSGETPADTEANIQSPPAEGETVTTEEVVQPPPAEGETVTTEEVVQPPPAEGVTVTTEEVVQPPPAEEEVIQPKSEETKGGKKHKTRKFRIKNKNKSEKIKK